MAALQGPWYARAGIAIASCMLTASCDLAVVPDDVDQRSEVIYLRPNEWVERDGVRSRFTPLDAEIPEDRQRMLRSFRRALDHSTTAEEAENIRLTIKLLEELEDRETVPVISSDGQSSEDLQESDGTVPPSASTYMNFTPEDGTYRLSGTTLVTTEGVRAVIEHDVHYSVGSTSRRLMGHNSGTARTLFTTWIDITCGETMSVTGVTDSRRLWTTGHRTSGQGYLGTRTCQPLSHTGCGDGPQDPFTRDPSWDTSYDPYLSYDSTGSCGSAEEDGTGCTREYIRIEVYDESTGLWSLWWEGYATVCE